MGDTKIQMDSKSTKHQKSEFTMRVGKHEAKVRFGILLPPVIFSYYMLLSIGRLLRDLT